MAALAEPADPPRQIKEFGVPVVIIDGVAKSYAIAGGGEVAALSDISLADRPGACPPIRRGEFLMIRGPSGGGKTTLLNIIGALDRPSRGTVSVLGTAVDSTSSDEHLSELRLAKIGFVFQTFNLIATMSAFENVELPMALLGKLSASRRRERALKLLRMVGLRDRATHLPSELSGGEQQRVTIARALANEPEVLLLDEPTGDLDTRNTVEIMDLLLALNVTLGVTCVMVTHNPDVECYADRIVYVRDGAIQRQVVNSVQCRIDLTAYLAHLAQSALAESVPHTTAAARAAAVALRTS